MARSGGDRADAGRWPGRGYGQPLEGRQGLRLVTALDVGLSGRARGGRRSTPRPRYQRVTEETPRRCPGP